MFARKPVFSRSFQGLLVLAVVALLVMSFANPANAQLMRFDGTVISVDRSASTVTLKAGDAEHTFKLSENATVSNCGEPQTIYGISVGDNLTVWYRATGSDNFVADSINYMLSAPEMC